MFALVLDLPQIIEPSYALDLGSDSTAPQQNLVLSSIRGIRSQGLTRGALAYNRLGGLVYPSATIGVVYSRKEHRYEQREGMNHVGMQMVYSVFLLNACARGYSSIVPSASQSVFSLISPPTHDSRQP